MSSTTKTRTTRPAARTDAATATVAAPGPGQRKEQDTPARTDTEHKLWDALTTYPGATTATLARHAEIGVSTAGKALAPWHGDGRVTRTPGAEDGEGRGKRRTAGTWTIAAPAAAPTATASDVTDTDPAVVADTPRAPAARGRQGRERPTAATGAGQAAQNTNGGPRLRKGELRGQVEDHLREHPVTEFSPDGIGNKLGRQSGRDRQCPGEAHRGWRRPTHPKQAEALPTRRRRLKQPVRRRSPHAGPVAPPTRPSMVHCPLSVR